MFNAQVSTSARGSDVRRRHRSPIVSQPHRQSGPQEPGVAAARRSLSIAVYDASLDRRQLLTATLYGLGCRIVPLDCASDAPEFLRAQLIASRPDVVVWQLEAAAHDQCAAFLAVLESGTLAAIGVVVTTLFPAQAAKVLGKRAPMVTMLTTPFSLVDLMRAVNGAPPDCTDVIYA